MEATMNSNLRHVSSSSKTNNQKIIRLCLYIIVFVGLITSLTSVFPLSSFLNRFALGVYLIALIFLILSRWKFKSFVIAAFVFLLILVDALVTGEGVRRINDLFYFPLWCLNLLAFASHYDVFRREIFHEHKLFLIFSIVWNLITLLSFVYPGSFIMSNSVRSFVGLTGQSHRFSETALLALLATAVEFVCTRKKRLFLLMILPLFATYLSGARTYLIVALLFFLFIILFSFNNRFLKFGILLGGLLLVLYAGMYVTSQRMGTTDYAWQISQYGTMHFITSGRSDFWLIDLEHFFQSPFIYLLIGRGYNYVYIINETYYASAIYAHNDYINVLLAHGFLGLFIFLAVFVAFIRTATKQGRIKIMYLALFLAIIVFNASFNMVYTYAVANMMTPLFGVIMLGGFDRKRQPYPLGFGASYLGGSKGK